MPSTFAELEPLWNTVMLGRSKPIRLRVEKLSLLTYMPHRRELNFHTNIVPCPSSILAVVLTNERFDNDKPWTEIVMTGWKLKVSDDGILEAGKETFSVRKIVSWRNNFREEDAVLKQFTLEAEKVRRHAAELDFKIGTLLHDRRVNGGLSEEGANELLSLRQRESELLMEPRTPRVLVGLSGVDPNTVLDLDKLRTRPAFRAAVIEEAAESYSRDTVDFLASCSGEDQDEHWELLQQHVGSTGMSHLIDEVLKKNTYELGKLTFFPDGFLDDAEATALRGQKFLDLRPILPDAAPGTPVRAKNFVWVSGPPDNPERLQLSLPGAYLDFSAVPPMKIRRSNQPVESEAVIGQPDPQDDSEGLALGTQPEQWTPTVSGTNVA